MKNKFFVFIEGFYGSLFILMCGVGAFSWFAIDAFGEDIILTICFFIALIILPILLFLYGLFISIPQLEVTDEGIIKKLFGHKIKFMTWDKVKCVCYKGNNFGRWLFLSEKDLTDKSISRCRLSRGTFFFFVTEKKMNILKQYIPEEYKNLLD